MGERTPPDPARIALLGVDAGGTKTAGLAMTPEGRVVAHVVAGPGNYQAVGVAAARATLADVVRPLVEACRREALTPAAIAYGLSGLDRPKDRAVLDRMTAAVAVELGEPALAEARVLVNDTFLILRAGSDDGVGVAVVSGTGANTVGRGPDGREARVGGLASELGDTGGGTDIAIAGLRAARRGKDGRGPRTLIEDLVVRYLGLEEIEDLVDFMIPGDVEGAPSGPRLPFGALASSLAPLVFEAAAAGDEVARAILTEMGHELGLSVRLVASRLFRPDDPFPLVFGGSVLTRATDPLFARTIEEEARTAFPRIEVRTLQAPPVLGGILLAWDWLVEAGEMDPTRAARRHDPVVREVLTREVLSAPPGTTAPAATTRTGPSP